MDLKAVRARSLARLDNLNARRPVTVWILAAVALAVLFAAFPVRDKSDSLLAVPASYRLLTTGTLDVTDYVEVYHPFHGIEWVGEKALPLYPMGASIMALPVVALFAPFYGDLTDPVPLYFGRWSSLEGIAAALIGSIATLCLFWVLRSLSGSASVAFWLTAIFALASPTLSTVTRALWQHGPVMVCYLSTFILLIKGRQREELITWAALPTAFAVVCRPLTGIFVVAVTFYVLLLHRRKFLPFILVGCAMAVVWLALIYLNYGTLLSTYYRFDSFARPSFVDLSDVWWALLISPSRGLLIYCPYLLVALFFLASKRLRQEPLVLVSCFMIIGHFLLILVSPNWWGGYSIGPRLMSDNLPFYFILMIPAGRWLLERQGASRLLFVFPMACAVAFAGWIHWRAAFSNDQINWDRWPISIVNAASYERLFDWRDPQFLRGTRWDGLEYAKAHYASEPTPGNPLAGGLSTTSYHPEIASYLGAGWFDLDRTGVWNASDRAELYLPMRYLSSGCDRLELVLEPGDHEPTDQIRVAVAIDDGLSVLWELTGQERERQTFALPAKRNDDDAWRVRIEFVPKVPMTAKLLGMRVRCD